jgi:solute carrier family 45 protein 1/2/4
MKKRSWAVASWAPWALIGVEINRLNMANSHSTHPKRTSIDLSEAQDKMEKASTVGGGASGSRGGASSGQYLGIMNLYTTLPQFMGTAISWVVFSILEPGKSPELSEAPPEEHHSTDGPNAIAVCLFIGACSACLAVVATMRLGRIQGKM